MEIINDRIREKDALNGYILDGVPRTLKQIHLLDKVSQINLVLEINLKEEILIEKALARRACEKCGESYNLYSIDTKEYKMPPLLPKRTGHCDKCDGKLFQRADDNREIIEKRLNLYKDNYGPIKRAYLERGLLQRFDLRLGVDKMWPILKSYFE
ncbi:hypothetical protein MHBO_002506 [Bonamia ostreae]|uniref:Adenylate kinase active site lid domain-containing protein n=1 Tax=Bonamia ostreae TaxID=126728 RepID=A0ABV2AN03_9EUKA